MIGIYLITNSLNGKKYVGQSIDIQRRFKEHQSNSRYKLGREIDIAIKEYGKENFTYEVLEECSKEMLDKKEIYWIEKLNTYGEQGYNKNKGGNQASIGEDNGNSKLSEQEVLQIRTDYANHLSQEESYEKYKNKISFLTFQSIWNGRTWSHILPEVFTEENKAYYRRGGNHNCGFSEAEVNYYRTLYQNRSAKSLYEEYLNTGTNTKKSSFGTFQQMLIGATYKELPFYSKKTKKWYYNRERPEPHPNRGNKTPSGNLTSKEVLEYRKQYVLQTAKEVYEASNKELSFESFRKMLEGRTYKQIPYYKKSKKEWIYPEAVSTISESGE